MFRDIFVHGSQAMISTLSWNGSAVSGYPEPESTLEMYEVPDGPDPGKCEETDDSENDKIVLQDVLSGRLSYVSQSISTLPFRVIDSNWHWVTTLDLSHNKIEEPDFIVYFDKLDTLILDHNCLNSKTVFPRMQKLKTLWINFNLVAHLYPFVENLGQSFPKLSYLSMMGNPAAPSFVNGGIFHDYLIYRFYVISQLKDLQYLDDRQIEVEERKEATKMHPSSYPMDLSLSKSLVSRTDSTKHFSSHLEMGHPVYTLANGSEIFVFTRRKIIEHWNKRKNRRIVPR